MRFNDFKSQFKPRKANTHKGDYGHVLVIAGNQGMSGAAKLAALGALRTGAGLVTVATHPTHAETLNSNQPEIMCHGISTSKALKPLLARATVVLLGPGLGRDAWAKNLAAFVFRHFHGPMVLDADGLHYLSQYKNTRQNWVLTPHPGEAAQLLQIDKSAINTQRAQTAQKIQTQYGGVVVLKGHGTIVCDETKNSMVCAEGNPGMASGGMGDLLSGIIAALIAQGFEQLDAAKTGVCLHAHSGDLAATQLGERGLLASDLLPFIHRSVNPA